jgi:hypothetical protein
MIDELTLLPDIGEEPLAGRARAQRPDAGVRNRPNRGVTHQSLEVPAPQVVANFLTRIDDQRIRIDPEREVKTAQNLLQQRNLRPGGKDDRLRSSPSPTISS